VQAGYQYDNEGRVKAVTGANYGGVSSYIGNINYRAFGGAKAIAYGNGKSLTMGYDNRLRLKKWDLSGLLGYEYAYDSYAEHTGRVTFADSIYDPTLDRSYVYDAVGRLDRAYSGSEARATIGTDTWGHPDGPYAQGFEYDQWGNMIRGYGWGGWFGSSADNRPTYVNNRIERNPTTSAVMDYDEAGNLKDDGVQTFKYDATGQQVFASGTTLSQSYDGHGLRVRKMENNQSTYYLRSSVLGGQVLAEVSRDNGYTQWMRGYVYLGTQMLAIQDGATLWVHNEPVTKGQRLPDTAGNVVSTVEVAPFGGETLRMSSQWRQPHRYTTYERDANGGDERWRGDMKVSGSGSHSLTPLMAAII
jgi:hypothetical protein